MTHPHKRRRSHHRKESAYEIDGFRVEDASYWKKRLKVYPLLRYRTQYPSNDVVTLIQTMDTANISRRVIFDRMPTPLEETGAHYNFYIEYRKFNSRKNARKMGQIEGRVISGVAETTIEFRCPNTSQGLRNLVRTILWFFLLFCPLTVGAFLLFIVFSKDMTVAGFMIFLSLMVFEYIYTLWVVLNWNINLQLDEGMKPILKKLDAVKMGDVSKRKNDETSKAKHGI